MTHPAPIPESQRIEAIDVVRGFALLGILVPNIVAFGWPEAAMHDPAIMGIDAWNETGRAITAIFFQGKMMALFSMLFGAGVVIYARKFERDENGAKPPLSRGAYLWYRRVAWLMVIGALHGVFLWYGDILVMYAVSGMLALWWVRRINPKWQIVIGLLLHLLNTALWAWAMFHESAGSGDAGPALTDAGFEFTAYTGGYLDTFRARLPSTFGMWFFVTPMFTPAVTGLMMIGMGLLRLDILTGKRPIRFYADIAVLGLLGGLGLSVSVFQLIRHEWPESHGILWMALAQFLGIPTSLGYMALLIWIVRLGILRPITHALAAVGRMALSNYLLQSILCTTFFYGYGMDRFGRIDYPGLFAVVAAVWIVNIIFSLVWLRYFRFGPAEWAWRSLTYWQLQPMKKTEGMRR